MTSPRIDQDHLRTKQYHNASNLNARAELHRRFSTNPTGWNRWVFDQLDLPANARILELGCGPAWLWAENRERIPAGWRITLSDFSEGMLDEARQRLADAPDPFTFEHIDAQQISLPAATFDAVIANHMLYHVPDRAKALAEIRRVLKSGGTFYAATNGRRHLQEMHDLVQQFDTERDFWRDYWAGFGQTREEFTLEDSGAEIARYFADVRATVYEDALVITEVEPLVDYMLSGSARDLLGEADVDRLRAFLAQKMTATGAVHITKSTGLFSARRI